MHGIAQTPARMQLLHMVLERGDYPFSVKEIRDEVKDKKLLISSSSVIMTLKLFNMRGIIKVDTNTTHSGIGRPALTYVLSGENRCTL